MSVGHSSYSFGFYLSVSVWEKSNSSAIIVGLFLLSVMEKKKKDQKLDSACNQESETIEPLKDQEQAQPEVPFGTCTRTSSPPHDHTTSLNQQPPHVPQWSCTPLNAAEQFPAISIPTQASCPSVLNQWQQLPYPQQGSTNQVQHGHGQAFVQSTPPFWQPQRPCGLLLGGNVPNFYQPFTPLVATDVGWQAKPVIAGGTSSRSQPLVPNLSSHVGCTFPGFPGPWDPSSWLGQIQQLQPPYAYNFPGSLSYCAATPTMPGCLPSVEHSFQKGIIRPPVKLSQKHQQLWEAQSAENVQLWGVINNLQSEVSEYKDRVMKLTEEVSSLKQKLEKPTAEGIMTVAAATGQAPKRGRPRRSVPSVDTLHESQPRTRGRKPAQSKAKSEIKSLNFEKVILKNVENKEKVYHSATAMIQQENIEKISTAVTHINGNIGVNQSNSMMSTLQAQVHQEYQGIQICGTAFNSSLAVKGNVGQDKNLKITYCGLSQPDKVLTNNRMDASANYMGSTGNGSLGWPSDISSQDSARNVFDKSRQSLFNNSGSFVNHGGKITHGWNFANEEGASEDLEDAVLGSPKDENEEELGDEETSSDAEEIGGTKDADSCAMNTRATSPKGLPSLHNW